MRSVPVGNTLCVCRGLLKAAMQQLPTTARAYHRILKLARAIAHQAGRERLQTVHVAETNQNRPPRQF